MAFEVVRVFSIYLSIYVFCYPLYMCPSPATRVQQAKLFNDKDSPCQIMVATDAIGMGLNLWVIFTCMTSLFLYICVSLSIYSNSNDIFYPYI